MLSPSKDEAVPLKTSPSTPQQIFSWTLTPEAIASCHVRDVISLQERMEGMGEPAQTNKHAGCDFYWLGRVPCRNVRVVGLVVEVTQYEYRTLYTIDDGTGVLECAQRTPAVQHVPEPGKPPPIAPEYPTPAANVGDCVCVTGRAQRKGEFWQLAIDSIERSPSMNDELKHYLAVRGLHETHYDLKEPFVVPISDKVGQAGPSTPTRKLPISKPPSRHPDNAQPSMPTGKQSMAEPSTFYVAPSSPPTVFASSPVKEQVPATPTKLRHPSRLHHAELTQNTFRIYLKYFMDNGPTYDNDDPFFASHTTPTKASTDSTPRPTRFSKSTTRPSIDPIDFSTSPHRKEKTLRRGYSISYLRRVPELALLAHRVAKQEIRTARKQAKEKEKTKPSSSNAGIRQSSTPTKRDVKRLFIRAVNALYREGSIVIWDCPSHSCTELPAGDSSFLWKTSSSLPAPSANTTTGEEDLSGNLSDPDPNEDVYVPITPEFMASRLEELIPVVQKAERMRPTRNAQAYSGASTEGLLRHLKKDDRWNHLHMDSVEAALKYLDDDGRAWMSGQGQWQLTV